LEGVFSLHLADSALTRLNAQGRLDAPPFELVELRGRARRIHAATGGAFDPTVQPLWAHYRDRALGRTPETDLATARGRVGLDRVRGDAGTIAFDRPGMALTLNGIAQGEITDRVAAIFRAAGLSCLVSLGEQRALGRSPDGDPWMARIADPDGASGPRIALRDQALAVSDPAALRLGPVDHILDPRSGGPAETARRAAVRAPRAADADGFSTAFAILPEAAARAAAKRAGVELLEA
jgi:thiamine biosynthesis lipoprotein